MIKEIKISAIETSYEIVWAIARNAPKREYFELESHPAPKVGYTDILEIARKARVLKVNVVTEKYVGVSLHIIRAKHRAKVGAKKNIREFA